MPIEFPRFKASVVGQTQTADAPKKEEDYLPALTSGILPFIKQNTGLFTGLAIGLFTGNYIQYNQPRKAQLPYEISIPGFLAGGLSVLGSLPIGPNVVAGLQFEVKQGVDALNALAAREREVNLKLSQLDTELAKKTMEIQKKAKEIAYLDREADKLRYEIEMLHQQATELSSEEKSEQ